MLSVNLPKIRIIYLFSIIIFLAIFYQVMTQSTWHIPKTNIEAKKYFIGEQKIFDTPIGFNVFEPAGKDYLLPFSQPIQVSGFSFLFSGNLHQVSSFLAKNFSVYNLNSRNEWVLLDVVKKNNDPFYNLKLESNIISNGFKINFHDPLAEKSIWLHNLNFYILKRVNSGEFLNYLYTNWYNSPLGYYLFPAMLYIFIFIPGYMILTVFNETRQSTTKLRNELIPVFAPVVSLVILSLLSLVFLAIGLKKVFHLYPIIFFICLIGFLCQGHLKRVLENKTYLFVLIASCFVLISVQGSREFLLNAPYFDQNLLNLPKGMGYFGYHTDNTGPWSFSRVLLNKVSIFSNQAHDYFIGWDPSLVFQRPPFLALLGIPTLYFFGEGHFIYNGLLILMVGLYFQASYALIKQELGFKIAVFVFLVLILNMRLVYSPNNSEVFLKYFSIYFCFLSLIFFNSLKNDEHQNSITKDLLCSFLLGLSFFAHPMALAIILLLLIIILITHRISRSSFYRSAAISLFPLLVFLGWYVLVPRFYLHPDDTKFNLKPNTYIDVLSNFSIESLQNRVFNFINLFFPKFTTVITSKGISGDTLYHFFHYSIISVVSPLLLFLLVMIFKKKIHFPNKNFFIFSFGPLVLFFLAIPTYSLGGWSVFYPFCLPFIFSLSAVSFFQMSINRQICFALSYIFWMGTIIINFSGLVSNFVFPSFWSIVFLSLSLGSFFIFAMFLIRLLIKSQKHPQYEYRSESPFTPGTQHNSP